MTEQSAWLGFDSSQQRSLTPSGTEQLADDEISLEVTERKPSSDVVHNLADSLPDDIWLEIVAFSDDPTRMTNVNRRTRRLLLSHSCLVWNGFFERQWKWLKPACAGVPLQTSPLVWHVHPDSVLTQTVANEYSLSATTMMIRLDLAWSLAARADTPSYLKLGPWGGKIVAVQEEEEKSSLMQEGSLQLPTYAFVGTVGLGSRSIQADRPFPCPRFYLDWPIPSPSRRHTLSEEEDDSCTMASSEEEPFSATVPGDTVDNAAWPRTTPDAEMLPRTVPSMSGRHDDGGNRPPKSRSDTPPARLPTYISTTTPSVSEHGPSDEPFVQPTISTGAETTASRHDEGSVAALDDYDAGEEVAASSREMDPPLQRLSEGSLPVGHDESTSGMDMDDADDHTGSLFSSEGYDSGIVSAPEQMSEAPLQQVMPFVLPHSIMEGEHGSPTVDITPRLVSYFEINILERPNAQGSDGILWIGNRQLDIRPFQREECVAIGLSTSEFRGTRRMPGWDDCSFGYHGDDAGLFHNGLWGDRRTHDFPRFGAAGDTVGCGIDYLEKSIFFTLNGRFLGYAFGELLEDDLGQEWYPLVGMDTRKLIQCNFGQAPFRFDLSNEMIAKQQKAIREILHRQNKISHKCVNASVA